MSSQYVPDTDHLARRVSYTKQLRDAEDNLLGCMSAAFELRPDEKFLSATWLEFFVGKRHEQIAQSIVATAGGSKLPKSTAFAIGNVKKIKKACEIGGVRIRVINEPDGNNLAHVALKHWPRDEQELLAIIAGDAWSETVLAKDFVPA